MKYTARNSKACDACHKQKIRCARKTDTGCVSCHRRNTTCTFTRPSISRHPKLSSKHTLLREPESNHINLLMRLLDYRVASWSLNPSVPTLVLSFFRRAGPYATDFYFSTMSELLQEPEMPDAFTSLVSDIQQQLSSATVIPKAIYPHYTPPRPTSSSHSASTSSNGSSECDIPFN
ncbi:hypothetical protein DSO57_1026446 [Entomophthora muscae]|uniref:Uncharacterized protein n=1 Tax=Entomophthora muscae TaxID=34485 RepID=A0ACC2TP39_9FUNG|nr:hypothetical protein DSO57_1026446 [Entomophthora muscae]